MVTDVPLSRTRAHQGLIYVSGQVGRDPRTQRIAESFDGQARQALQNLKDALTEAGADLSTVLKTTVFIRHERDFPQMNTIYAEFFGEPYPARSTIVTDLARAELDFEIEAVAYAP